MIRSITEEETFGDGGVHLRLVTLADCSARYVAWLEDPLVNQYLETRWTPQTLDSVRAFVAGMVESPDSFLFAIIDEATRAHIGNIKVGPVHERHGFADVSYFIGERAFWGKGLATEAIRTASRVGFERLGVHRLQAGLYASNVGSGRALEKAGYRREGVLREQLRIGDRWEDHVWYGLLRSEWSGSAGVVRHSRPGVARTR